ncbi:MAG TPA: GNAT family protein [Chitinophagaceae bacterium]|nr:GNAT family protein [Chitinophagaceae bacterium]
MLLFNFIPFPELETDRLLLRRMNMADAPEMFFLRSDESVLKYIGKEPAKTIHEAEAFIEKIDAGIVSGISIMWAITLKENPEKMIGTICYWNMQPEHFRSEIGFLLHPDHWRKGIMKEAISKILDYGFSTIKLHSIEARVHVDNKASASVLEFCGFKKEGLLKEDFYFNGEFLDTLIFSRLQ